MIKNINDGGDEYSLYENIMNDDYVYSNLNYESIQLYNKYNKQKYINIFFNYKNNKVTLFNCITETFFLCKIRSDLLFNSFGIHQRSYSYGLREDEFKSSIKEEIMKEYLSNKEDLIINLIKLDTADVNFAGYYHHSYYSRYEQLLIKASIVTNDNLTSFISFVKEKYANNNVLLSKDLTNLVIDYVKGNNNHIAFNTIFKINNLFPELINLDKLTSESYIMLNDSDNTKVIKLLLFIKKICNLTNNYNNESVKKLVSKIYRVYFDEDDTDNDYYCEIVIELIKDNFYKKIIS